MKKLLIWCLKKTVINWNRPFYSKDLYEFSKRYIDLYNGDNNYHRNENGEFKVLQWINSMKKLNRVVDVGANVGSYSSDILSLNPKASITCFEPDPRAFKSLSEKLGHSSDVHLINKGVSDQKGTLRLNMAPRTTHTSFVDYGESIDAVSVEVTTLDDTKLTGHIDLIKIDVEGFEYKVLQGAKETLKRTSFVQFEFSGANHQSRLFVKDFIDYLNGYGFDLYKIKADRLTRISGNPEEERFALKNYLAIYRSMKTDAEIKI